MNCSGAPATCADDMTFNGYLTLNKLSREKYVGIDTKQIARSLLGTLLVVPDKQGDRVSGMIVETEAYLGVEDRAAHSYGGRRTPRNEVMYGDAGHAYVFFVYGMYYQFNAVTGPADHPHAILIRALEPVEGIEIMRERRTGRPRRSSATSPRRPIRDRDLTSGPGKLCIALGIDRSYNAEDLTGDRVWIEEYRKFRDNEIAVGPRIGIDYAGEDAQRPWRFWVPSSSNVSKRSAK